MPSINLDQTIAAVWDEVQAHNDDIPVPSGFADSVLMHAANHDTELREPEPAAPSDVFASVMQGTWLKYVQSVGEGKRWSGDESMARIALIEHVRMHKVGVDQITMAERLLKAACRKFGYDFLLTHELLTIMDSARERATSTSNSVKRVCTEAANCILRSDLRGAIVHIEDLQKLVGETALVLRCMELRRFTARRARDAEEKAKSSLRGTDFKGILRAA